MTTTLTAEKLAQRAVDVNVLTEQDLNGVWAEFGTRAVELRTLQANARPARPADQLSA